MARVSKWMIFVRAFLVTLMVGTPITKVSAGAGDDADWNRTMADDTADAYFWYLRRNPAGKHIEDAVDALRLLGALGAVGPAAGGAAREINLY